MQQDLLYQQPWFDELAPPAHIFNIPTMLHVQERRLLHYLAKSIYRGEGVVIDGGPFVGGSTVPICEGLRTNPQAKSRRKLVHSYDLFRVDSYMASQEIMSRLIPGLVEGDSFLPSFRRHTAAYSYLVDIHEGDVTNAPLPPEPVEIMFIDLSKTLEVNDWIVANWFPKLIPGHSIVIQQDYFDLWTSWLPVTMEYFSEYFELVSTMEWCTAVFRCVKQVPRVEHFWSSLSGEEKLQLVDRNALRMDEYRRGALACSKVHVQKLLHDHDRADVLIAEARARYGRFDRVAGSLDALAKVRW